MLACTETVTLVRQVSTAEGDSYSCQVIEGVSWFEKTGSALSAAKGEAPAVSVVVRIPEAAAPEPLPQAGDYMVKGTVDAVADRKALDGLDGFRIAAVGDNRRLHKRRHVVVKSG